jgi:hypothetical protein
VAAVPRRGSLSVTVVIEAMLRKKHSSNLGNSRSLQELHRDGRVQALRRGEAPILARYEGAYAAATVTVMGDREGFAWQEPEAYQHHR